MVLALAGLLAPAALAQQQLPTMNDPRAALAPGLENPGVAQQGMELLAHRNKPEGFFNPTNPGSSAFWNSDMAFQGNHAFVGNFNGFNIYDISNPANPTLTTSVVCPGGQGDLSVYGNLLFMSVEATGARVNCSSDTTQPVFRGVRIFDISNIAAPIQLPGVQTCRGSHTHTLLTPDDDPDNVYIYVSGTAGSRPGTDLAGCNASQNNGDPPTGENPTRWRIEVIKVPLAAPQNAAVVSTPRLFANEAGAVDGLQNAPQTPQHPSGGNWSPTPVTDACHDITVYEELDLAAGACEGNGILIDISDPANPVRIDAVADPIFAYWHGATFSNDGTKVVFTDEWGGGTQPRCRATDDLKWGSNGIYEIVNRKLVFRSYYKLPVAQTSQENCVSHIPSLIPVPGRDVFVQGWYQGGASMVDFTDASNPKEIGYYDRGPIVPTGTGGLWNTYWYNGTIYGSEMARGFDAWRLTPTADLSAGEIAAAENVKRFDRLNVQSQESFTWQDEKQVDVGGTVPGTLSLTVGAPASFGAFTPGVERSYEASTTANVVSTAGDAVLSVSDPSSTATGRLVNDSFSLPQPLQARARNAANTGTAFNNVGSAASPLNLLAYSGPISNDAVSLQFSQAIGANDALRTGEYSKTLTFTLSTTNP